MVPTKKLMLFSNSHNQSKIHILIIYNLQVMNLINIQDKQIKKNF